MTVIRRTLGSTSLALVLCAGLTACGGGGSSSAGSTSRRPRGTTTSPPTTAPGPTNAVVVCGHLINGSSGQDFMQLWFYDPTTGKSLRPEAQLPLSGSGSTSVGTVRFQASTSDTTCPIGRFDGSFTRMAGVATGGDQTQYPAYWDGSGQVTVVAGSPKNPNSYTARAQQVDAAAFPPGSSTLWWVENVGSGNYVLHKGTDTVPFTLPNGEDYSLSDAKIRLAFSTRDPNMWQVRVTDPVGTVVLSDGSIDPAFSPAPVNSLKSDILPASAYTPVENIVISTDGSRAYFVACQCTPLNTPGNAIVGSLWTVPTTGGTPTKIADVDAKGSVLYVGPITPSRSKP
jgi:hypothetical protein